MLIMPGESEDLVLELLRSIRADMPTKVDMAEIRAEVAEIRAGLRLLRADFAAGFGAMRASIGAGDEAHLSPGVRPPL